MKCLILCKSLGLPLQSNGAEFVEARGEARGEKIGMEKGIKIGKEETLRQSILNVLLIHPEWTDASVSKLLNVPVEMVVEERKNYYHKSIGRTYILANYWMHQSRWWSRNGES